jgi:transcriptional regulator with XRE-family HTH domain
MSDNINRFGEKLKKLREQKGLTLKEMADRLDLKAHGYISELESSKKYPTVHLVLKVSRLFGVTTDTLLKDELNIKD